MTKRSLNSTRYLYIYIPMKDDLYSLVVSGISYLGMPDLTFLTFCCNVFLLFSVQHTVKGQCHTNRIRNTHHGSINADTFSASHSSKLLWYSMGNVILHQFRFNSFSSVHPRSLSKHYAGPDKASSWPLKGVLALLVLNTSLQEAQVQEM